MAEFPDEKMHCRPVLHRRCQLEATESEELELMNSKMHIIQLSVNYSLELAGFVKAFAQITFSQKKYLSQRKYILSHVTMGVSPKLD